MMSVMPRRPYPSVICGPLIWTPALESWICVAPHESVTVAEPWMSDLGLAVDRHVLAVDLERLRTTSGSPIRSSRCVQSALVLLLDGVATLYGELAAALDRVVLLGLGVDLLSLLSANEPSSP